MPTSTATVAPAARLIHLPARLGAGMGCAAGRRGGSPRVLESVRASLTGQLQSIPVGFGHAVRGVLAERGRHVSVALGLAENYTDITLYSNPLLSIWLAIHLRFAY